ncbi:MAG: glycoside hydrolase family 15 protein, partial [Ktedonobacteraceae bacterium]|nr:glycoside hydrolase family 15 protein [Ktedonobacteraceae bacterium]
MQVTQPYLSICDHAIIGDLQTVALVGVNGTIDWYCLPRIDSPSVFGALLDANKGGFFRLGAADPASEYQQLYFPDTNVLLTRMATDDGYVELTDFMPIQERGVPDVEHALIRSVTGVYGELEIVVTCRPAFNYARDTSRLSISEEGALFRGSDFVLALASPVPLKEDGYGGVSATFTLRKGQSVHFLLQSLHEHSVFPQPLSDQLYQRLFRETLDYWYDWVSQCTYQGRWREMVYRSALVLKLL